MLVMAKLNPFVNENIIKKMEILTNGCKGISLLIIF